MIGVQQAWPDGTAIDIDRDGRSPLTGDADSRARAGRSGLVGFVFDVVEQVANG